MSEYKALLSALEASYKQLLDMKDQRIEFLRAEISHLKLRLDNLRSDLAGSRNVEGILTDMNVSSAQEIMALKEQLRELKQPKQEADKGQIASLLEQNKFLKEDKQAYKEMYEQETNKNYQLRKTIKEVSETLCKEVI